MTSPFCENCGGAIGQHAMWCKNNARSAEYVEQLVRENASGGWTDQAIKDAAFKSANDRQVAGDHYKGKAIQPWDYIAGNGLGYLEGNVVKYVSRWKDKGGLADLEKARHYLDKLIELEGQR